MRTRSLLAGPLLALAAGACTPSGGPEAADVPAIRDVLVLGTDEGSVTVDTSLGSPLRGPSGAVATFDGSFLFSTEGAGGSTTLTTVDPMTGGSLATRSLPGDLDVRVASVSGEVVALMAPLMDGEDAWTPSPRASTRVVIADPWSDDLRRYRLNGNYEPEAFSEDDRRLFMIQYLPAEAPAVYRVTVLDLATGDVSNVFGRFKTPPARMPGTRLSQVYDPVRAQLYTLYTNEPSSYLGSNYANTMPGESTTFVHVLSLRDGWAYCAGVPRSMWGAEARDQAMAVSPDGRVLYIVDTGQGLVSSMDAKTFKTLSTREIELGTSDGIRASATIGGDGTILFVGSSQDGEGIYAIDATTFGLLERWPTAGAVGALGLSADGARLYVVVGEEITAIDATSGAALGSFPVSGVESILDIQSPAPY